MKNKTYTGLRKKTAGWAQGKGMKKPLRIVGNRAARKQIKRNCHDVVIGKYDEDRLDYRLPYMGDTYL